MTNSLIFSRAETITKLPSTHPQYCNSMLTTNIIQRTFKIKRGDKNGTAFTYDLSGMQYLVTAKHIVDCLDKNGAIDIFHKGTWKTIGVRISYLPKTLEDIAVLSPEIQLSPTHKIETSPQVALSQDVYWCGFPSDIDEPTIASMTSGNFNNGFPIPLARKGTLSMFIPKKDDAPPIFLVAGHNLGGFSGSPLVYQDISNKSADLKIAGVVVEKYLQKAPIYYGKQQVHFLHHLSDTGTLVAHSLSNAVEFLAKNPSGFQIPPQPN